MILFLFPSYIDTLISLREEVYQEHYTIHKGLDSKYCMFMGHRVSEATTQLCNCTLKAVIVST